MGYWAARSSWECYLLGSIAAELASVYRACLSMLAIDALPIE